MRNPFKQLKNWQLERRKIKTVTDIYFFENGNTAATDKSEQIPKLQKSWLLLYVDFLKSEGIDPTKLEYHFACGKAKVFKTVFGYNWRFKK